jgi:hypothetical protein
MRTAADRLKEHFLAFVQHGASSMIQQASPRSVQQPDGGGTPGVAVAPVALAGAIMVGFARLIVTLWLHAAEFGVGTTVRFGSMLVSPSSVITG